MKKRFLEIWTGGTNSFGEYEKFKGGQEHSSLSDREKEFVLAGGVAFHTKGEKDTKVFVVDDQGEKWSVTVKNIRLHELKTKLLEVGYLLPAA